jgi:hypothetical protein
VHDLYELITKKRLLTEYIALIGQYAGMTMLKVAGPQKSHDDEDIRIRLVSGPHAWPTPSIFTHPREALNPPSRRRISIW